MVSPPEVLSVSIESSYICTDTVMFASSCFLGGQQPFLLFVFVFYEVTGICLDFSIGKYIRKLQERKRENPHTNISQVTIYRFIHITVHFS